MTFRYTPSHGQSRGSDFNPVPMSSVRKKCSPPFLLCLAALLFMLVLPDSGNAEEEPAPASQQEAIEALDAFKAWAEANRNGDYEQVWKLTDPRIRRWHDQRRWKKRMKSAHAKSGAIVSYDIEGISPVTASQLPCTEMGHCFRPGIQYVFFLIRSTYEKATPPQPEFAVMAKSEEGWKFGGGTFPDTPMGETSVILDRKDEEKYRYRGGNG